MFTTFISKYHGLIGRKVLIEHMNDSLTRYSFFFSPLTVVLLGISLLLSCHTDRVQNELSAPDNSLSLPNTNILVINSDTIITGATHKIIGTPKPIIVPPPKTILNPNAKTIQAHPHRNILITTKTSVIPSNIAVIQIGQAGMPLPKSLPLKPKRTELIYTAATKANPPQISDMSVADIRCIDIDEGLNSALVTCSLQDQRGHIWIGTGGGGISKYDGSSLVTFTEHEGLIHNDVNAMMEDHHGRIWIGTVDGLNIYDGHQFYKMSTAEGLSGNSVNDIIEDDKNRIWIATNFGLDRIDLPEGKDILEMGGNIVSYQTNQGIAKGSVVKLLCDDEGNIWFGVSDQGVYRLMLDEAGLGGKLINYNEDTGLSGPKVRSLLADSKGNIWIGTFNNGVNIFHKDATGIAGTFTQFTSSQGLSHRSVISMLEHSNGDIWLGTGGGVNQITINEKSEIHNTYYSTDQGLPHTNIYNILEDNTGNIWLGTYSGLCVIDVARSGKVRTSHFTHFSKKDGLLSDKVISILQDKRGVMWYGTMGGLHKYDGHSMTQYDIPDGLSSRSVRTMIEDKNGDLWFGTERGGLNQFTPNNNHSGGQISQFQIEQGLNDIHFTSMLEDKDGNLWFGTLGDGINRLNNDKKQFISYDVSNGLSSDRIRFLLEDHQGHIWIGSKGGGLSELVKNDDDTSGIIQHITKNEGLPHNWVNCIMEDHLNRLWVGTWGGGVAVIDSSRTAMSYYSTSNGLTSDIIWTIVEDDKNRIWMATEKGITLFAPPIDSTRREEYQIFQFAKEDGLRNLVFEGNSVCIDDQNNIWWGGGFNGGLSQLNLDKFSIEGTPPRLYFETIDVEQNSINYRHIDPTDIPDSHVLGSIENAFDSVIEFSNMPNRLTLPYDINHLTFRFSAIDWGGPHKLLYSHRISGITDTWSRESNQNFADYRNIPFGKYTFQVRCKGESGLWSHPIEYQFVILAPWWHTWWARILYGLTAFLLFSLFVKMRLAKAKEDLRNKELFTQALINAQEGERKRIARDLHDGVGQSLLLIKKQMERATATTEENQKLVAETLAEVRSISQDLHPFQLDKFGLSSAIEETLNKVQQTNEIFVSKEIDIIDKDILSESQEINLYRTIQEAISNVIKHAEASAIKVTVQNQMDQISVKIQDNGKGFDHDLSLLKMNSLGLKTMNERIQNIGGTFKITVGVNGGTDISINIPLKK